MSVAARCLGGPMDGEVVTSPGGGPVVVAIPLPLEFSLAHFEDRPRVEVSPFAPALKTGWYGAVKQLATPSGERVPVRLWEGER